MHKFKIVRGDGSHFTTCGAYFDTKDAARAVLSDWLEWFPNYEKAGFRVKATLI